MNESNPPEADEQSARDPHKASWYIDPIEYEVDETAGIVIAESEALGLMYEIQYRNMTREGWELDFYCSSWRSGCSSAIERMAKKYIEDDFNPDAFLGAGFSGILATAFVHDLEAAVALTSLFWEDVVGITIIPGTTKVRLHFSLEGLNNGGIAA